MRLPLIFHMNVLWHCGEAQMKVISHDFLECSWYKSKSQQLIRGRPVMAERIKEMHSSFVDFNIFKFRLHKYFILVLLLDFFFKLWGF